MYNSRYDLHNSMRNRFNEFIGIMVGISREIVGIIVIVFIIVGIICIIGIIVLK